MLAMYIQQVLIALFAGLLLVDGDIYMHNPRGSNNRQDEGGRQRANANRLFDSQNNNRGGYNVGPFPGEIYFYEGSQLRIQWANQHSCGDENNFCNIVIQYMCDDNLRDGTTTRKAPTNCRRGCDKNRNYGHHESLTYYEQCASRERNKGLFTADQKLRGNSAQHTRQNSQGNRYGYECPEERDYYPYFGPTPWKDIVVFTNDKARCRLYQDNSQNVNSKWACSLPDEYWDAVRGKPANRRKVYLYNDRESCEQVAITANGKRYTAEWKEYPPHGIDAPECLDEPWSRDNHQGNTIGGEFIEYNWTIPTIGKESKCTLRIRYNISTNDFEPWDTDSSKNYDGKQNLGPEAIYSSYVFNGESDDRNSKETEALGRNYVLKGNPQLDVFDLRKRRKKFKLRIALNTAQYGRVFQDRSHAFRIVPRPDHLSRANIYNVNVRGKRGNIVQVFPSTEYDFVPNKLTVKKNDHVHFQWTGSDKNPINNAGEGRARTDRNNIAQLALRSYSEGKTFLTLATNYPRRAANEDFLGLSSYNLTNLALSGLFERGITDGATLDRAKAYFDLGEAQMTKRGTYHYFSTRNNNFSNRDQKATIIVN